MTGSTTVHFRIAWAAFKAYRRVLVISALALFGSWVSLELAVVAVHRRGVLPNLALHLAFLFLFSGLMVGIQSIALQVVDGLVPTLRSLPAMLDRGPSFRGAMSQIQGQTPESSRRRQLRFCRSGPTPWWPRNCLRRVDRWMSPVYHADYGLSSTRTRIETVP